ncbi:MAG: GNAT family N-acetyltransferase [Clostridia bacterium]|nr:GNAT family N-acetyltransferase [Clostridia bacterium]
MENIKIVPVNKPELIEKTANLAKKIWFEHYISIISEGQIEYMVNKFQSKKAIKNQIDNENYQYFILEYDGESAGYFAMCVKDKAIFLSKLYIDKAYRRKGLATAAISFMSRIAKRDSLDKIWLTVNKNNNGSIKAYEKLGFKTEKTQVADIGEGYVMDDYIMEKIIEK